MDIVLCIQDIPSKTALEGRSALSAIPTASFHTLTATLNHIIQLYKFEGF